MRWFILTVTNLLLFTCVHCQVEIGSNSSLLTLYNVNKYRLDGTYIDHQAGCGIKFNSTSDSLIIKNMNDKLIVGAEENTGEFLVVAIGHNQFIQHRQTGADQMVNVFEYAIPKSHGNFYGEKNHEKMMELVNKLSTMDINSRTVLKKSVSELTSGCEVHLMRNAAFDLGKQGITGYDYPSALPFYLSALQTSSYQHFNAIASSASDLNHLRVKRSSCSDTNVCPPCKDHECLGMCGPGCDCWKFVCGDCCYYLGCHSHDLCCRSHPDSLACLMPIQFDCHKEYVCELN